MFYEHVFVLVKRINHATRKGQICLTKRIRVINNFSLYFMTPTYLHYLDTLHPESYRSTSIWFSIENLKKNTIYLFSVKFDYIEKWDDTILIQETITLTNYNCASIPLGSMLPLYCPSCLCFATKPYVLLHDKTFFIKYLAQGNIMF